MAMLGQAVRCRHLQRLANGHALRRTGCLAPPLCSTASARRHSGAQAGTAAPWCVNPSKADYEEQAAASILEHGLVMLPSLLPPEALGTLRRAMVGHAEEVLQSLQGKGVALSVGSRAGFHEVVLRSPGRYDVPCEFESVPAEVLTAFERIAAMTLARKSGSKAAAAAEGARAFAGIVRAEPGSPPQLWHADSPHQRAEHEGPNLLNVVVALHDLHAGNGATELLPGSQVLTNHHRPGAKFGAETLLYQNDGNTPELIGSSAEPVPAVMPEGSALIFDDRILHRGGGNSSSVVRDLAFFSYHGPDFTPATHYEATRALSKYDHKALAEEVRPEFPGLRGGLPSGEGGGGGGGGDGALWQAPEQAPVFADGASGSQLHRSAVEAAARQMVHGVANVGGGYTTSKRVGKAVLDARRAMADFMCCAEDEVVFGPSMTALAYQVAAALRRSGRLQPGDNLVLDPISHGANVFPWVEMGEACGAEVRWLPVAPNASVAGGPSECVLDTRHEALAGVIDRRSRFVAAGAASNGVGSIHDVRAIFAAASELSERGAVTFVDAVHSAPHFRVDVQDLGCDFLACSTYKFFAPHAGVLFGRRELLASLPAQRLNCQSNSLPSEENCFMSRWELGTQNFEALAGVTAAVDYLASLGPRFGGCESEAPRRVRLDAAWRAVVAHESELKARFLSGAAGIRGLRIMGITDPSRLDCRTSTFAVAKEGCTSSALAKALCARGIWCTAGNHYAGFWAEQSKGLLDNGTGMARLGFLHYNTLEEVDRVLAALEDI